MKNGRYSNAQTLASFGVNGVTETSTSRCGSAQNTDNRGDQWCIVGNSRATNRHAAIGTPSHTEFFVFFGQLKNIAVLAKTLFLGCINELFTILGAPLPPKQNLQRHLGSGIKILRIVINNLHQNGYSLQAGLKKLERTRQINNSSRYFQADKPKTAIQCTKPRRFTAQTAAHACVCARGFAPATLGSILFLEYSTILCRTKWKPK